MQMYLLTFHCVSKDRRKLAFNPDIEVHILLTVLHTFLMELVRGICLNIKTSYPG